MIAAGLYLAARERGLRIPDDLSVIGFDDMDFARVLSPPLTTVALDAELLGSKSFELLEQRMSGKRTRRRVVLPAELLVRGSTADVAPRREDHRERGEQRGVERPHEGGQAKRQQLVAVVVTAADRDAEAGERELADASSSPAITGSTTKIRTSTITTAATWFRSRAPNAAPSAAASAA